ncbi:hypothetical protein SAMN04488564_105586 [Lentzea waywayandensis]|uniref:Uncharacterized protein n=1 Tax=Lentzea waywayandensis TaxID=84724 RepID=A0A1I6EV01_9PSEU|nr:hypothetical protein [Lentzea waywayandensis]SFR21382.1 hypothetical protein SAMN04488564_105586 [Lentzea waywayandensis]
MNDDDIRTLLSGAVPDLPESNDRVAAVRDRAARHRRRRRSVVSGAVVLLAVAAATTVPLLLRGEPVEPFTAGGEPTAGCPAYTARPTKLGQGAAGQLLPDGAVRATMCVYRVGTSGNDWQTEAVTIDRDVAEVVSTLNALPDHDTFVAEHPEARDAGCTMSLRPQYLMRFEYPDGSSSTVDFAMNCGTVENGDVVRFGEITKALDAFTTSYRAQGGAVPDPPWKW